MKVYYMPEFTEEDRVLTYKTDIRRLEKEKREWKSLAEDRYKRMKKLSKQMQLLKKELHSDANST